jgi:hypothetical protein
MTADGEAPAALVSEHRPGTTFSVRAEWLRKTLEDAQTPRRTDDCSKVHPFISLGWWLRGEAVTSEVAEKLLLVDQYVSSTRARTTPNQRCPITPRPARMEQGTDKHPLP